MYEDLKIEKGSDFEDILSSVSSALKETDGIIITCSGRPIGAEYHIACGGGTQNSEDVIDNRVIYLRRVLCKYCLKSPYWEEYIDIPIEELERKLKVKIVKQSGIVCPCIEDTIEKVERDETGRVKKVLIGGKVFTGEEIARDLKLNSSRFGWDVSSLRFKVRGRGNGLGLCLYGANGMAGEGRKFDEILKYYYTNIELEPVAAAGGETPLKGRFFIIDPGHGGMNGGDESGPGGIKEKDVNLYISKKLKYYLEKSGALVSLTREDDEEKSLPERIEFSNEGRPNFLISIHQNSFFAPNVSGTEVYFYRGDREGERLARCILENITKALDTINRGCRQADFYILRESKVSAVEVECMYISNPEEEKLLANESIRDEIARSVYRGIMDYYGI